jgi:putative nucleotidyltransferase with HDIG domain
MRKLGAIHLYVAAVFVAAVAMLWEAPWVVPGDPSQFWNAMAAFLVLALVSELAFLKLPIATSTSSVSFIPYLAAIALVGPSWAMALTGVATFSAETFVRRKPLIKVVLNTSKEILAVGLAGILYLRFGGSVSLASLVVAPLAFTIAVCAYMIVNIGAPAIAIALSSGARLRDSWNGLVGGSLLFDFLASPLALLLAFLYTEAQLAGVIVVTIPLFLIRHVYSVNLRLEQSNRDLLELMVKNIEARDPYTSGHSVRVARLAQALARALGLSAKEVAQIETAALLHDVGKIHEEFGVMLRKQGRLTAEEMALMRTHPIRSYELVHTISGFRGGVDLAVRHHHENYDGSGYPDGLAGDKIPIGARIIMIADTADAMTTDRPYRAALPYEDVLAELERYAGMQFDPQLVKLFAATPAIRVLVQATKIGQESSRELPTQRAVQLA